MGRLVISGASGFLGRNIIRKAQEQGLEVLAIAFPEEMLPTDTINIHEFLSNGYSFSKEDVFMNCLFPTNADGYQMADGLKNLYKTITMAYNSNAGAMINISSQSVYNDKREFPACETDPLCLDTPYAVGKYSSEAYVNSVWKGRPHTNIRMSSLLGIGYDQRIVNRMIIQAINGTELKVIGGMQRYGFLDVRDAASGLIMIASSDPQTWMETYNLGRPESYTLVDVVETICEEIKKKTGMDTRYNIVEGEDYRNSAIDPSRFMEQFDWKPEISLPRTTADIIDSKYKAE